MATKNNGSSYFGSVKFFKHLIIAVIFGWIAAATVLSVYFGVKLHKLENTSAFSADLAETMDRLKVAGYSGDDILYYLEGTDHGIVSRFAEKNAPSFVVGDETVADLYVNGEDAPEISQEDVQAGNFFTFEPEQETEAEQTETVTSAALAVTEVVQTEADESQTTVSQEEFVADTELSDMYPELYVEKSSVKKVPDSKTVFLTFDDGPSENTYDILYILDKHNIKATFFMSAGKTERCEEQMRAVAEAGHSIGVHSFSHDTDVIYSSAKEYLDDFYVTCKMINDASGVMPTIYRMPDSSSASPEVLAEIKSEMERRGFTHFGYNAESGDRSADKSWQHIYDTVLENVCKNTQAGRASVVHLHDSADDYTTVLTTEDIIKKLKAEGFSFGALDSSADIG